MSKTGKNPLEFGFWYLEFAQGGGKPQLELAYAKTHHEELIYFRKRFLEPIFEVRETFFAIQPILYKINFDLKLNFNLKYSLLFAFVFLLGGLSSLVQAQNCKLTLSGQVVDLSTHTPIAYANVFLEENQKGAVSDSAGYFEITAICAASYHINVSHIGCATQRFFFDLNQDTLLHIHLDHFSQLLDDLVIKGQNTPVSTQEAQSINVQKITQNAAQNLSNMLGNLAGVSTLKNGSSIAKPVVHGLYGNRLTILNNGVPQSGQQWGNDHSPEIDPLVANRITVLKGVSALEYQGSSLGSVVLVSPKVIDQEPHLHGRASYFFESNGRGNGLNIQLHQAKDAIAWKLNGTLKRSGDRHTPDYFLRNTGSSEANIALQLEKLLAEKWQTDLYFSSFNTRLGVLRGAHIGNLTDLERALSQEEPFFTIDTFKNNIEAPYQDVNHQLLKVNTKYFFTPQQWMTLTYAGQLNNRKEFDIRRGGRSEKPSLSLLQWSHFFEAKYHQAFDNDWNLKSGVQGNITENDNEPGTGVLPLIPDYMVYDVGGFVIFNRQYDRFFVELGGRYDYKNQRVATISRTIPREIIRYNNHFHNLGAVAGVNYQLSDEIKLNYNIGYASRNPAVNELYSNGLHQGVSGIEEGDIDLQVEKSVKTTLSVEGRSSNQLFFEGLFFLQNIQDYIYLQPQDEFRLTIRGAFPVFRYEQTNARLYGTDWTAGYHILDNFQVNFKYSYLRGQDLSNNMPLIGMPSNNLLATANYQIANAGRFENVEIELNHQSVFEQKNLLATQDFVLPPETYHLLNAKISGQYPNTKSRLNLYLKIDNLLNTAYRDYLNRQRYFADDLGRNITIGGTWIF